MKHSMTKREASKILEKYSEKFILAAIVIELSQIHVALEKIASRMRYR